jgi:hypothetical protein
MDKYELQTQNVDLEVEKKIEEFERNYMALHPEVSGCIGHNIYYIKSEDRDGNITGEFFGLNVMTDAGFQRCHTGDSYQGDCDQIFLGDGDFQTIDPSSTSMVHLIANTSATMTSTEWSYWGSRYIPEKESNLSQFRLCIGYFDYTVWNVDHEVTEIGITDRYHTGPTNLKFHAAIYDAEGQKTSFWKRVNEKLTINVFARWFFPIVKIVNESWDKGIPCAICSYTMCQLDREDWWNQVTVSLSAPDWQYHRLPNNAETYRLTYNFRNNNGSITDHVWSNTCNMTMNLFIDGSTQSVSDISIHNTSYDAKSHILHYPYFHFISRVKSDQPIPFQWNWFSTTRWDTLSLRNNYGSYANSDNGLSPTGRLPMIDMHISSIKMYNCQTDEWDIDVPFTEPVPYIDNSLRWIRYYIWDHNYITFQNTSKWFSVFINEAPQYPIKRIINANRTMYATDSYWDSSTWEIIPNTNNISRELGGKRYIIMFDQQFDWPSGDDEGIQYYASIYYCRRVERWDYEESFPKLNLNNGSGSDSVNSGWRSAGLVYWRYNYTGKAIKNDDIGYIAQDGFLVYPDTADPNPDQYYPNRSTSGQITDFPYVYNIGGITLPDIRPMTGTDRDGSHPGMIWNTTRGTRFIVGGMKSWSTGFRVYTPNIDPSIAPTHEDFRFDAVWNGTPTMSESDNGYVVVSYISGSTNKNQTYVFAYDVENEPASMYKVEGIHHAVTIELTNYFVGVDATVSDHLHLIIYDMANQRVHGTFDIPEGYSISGISGWNNFVYVRVVQGGAYSTYLYYINEQMLELTAINAGQMITDNSSWACHVRRCVPANGNIESCMVLLASNRNPEGEQHLLFKESNPANPIAIVRQQNYETSSYVHYQKAWLGYTPDNKQLLLTYSTRRSMCIDIGYVMRRGTQSVKFTWPYLYSGDAVDLQAPILYKGYIYQMRMYSWEWNNSADRSRFYFHRTPYQTHLDNMQIIGDTYTPNALMNPVRIQGKIATFFMSDTNRDVDTPPAPYVPPEEEPGD